MNLDAPSLAANREDVDAAAEVFARHIHDDWGVGLQTTPSCGGTGVLIFLAIDDRAVYISRGSAVESVLSNRRLDKTIQAMKPDLLERNYGQALLLAIRELDSLLLVGGPDWKERSVDFVVEYLTYFVFAAFIGIVAVAARHEQRQRREYAAVASHLNELDRSRAEALQGRFQAKSCPICLESFMFADDNPSSESNENETAPLMCTGSDGLPLKLLRCGHVFDDTCWAEWISSGHHGKINKCPICQQDVGQSTDTATTATAGANTFSTRTDDIIQTDGLHEEEARQRALRQYTHDRNFRLLRLATRYPRYVRPQQLQTWSQVGYDGSLARDPSFVNSDPARQSASSGNGNGNGYRRSSGGGASGFGGGMSGGGRGGRW
jgi:uncharacterized membrane protein YgcG